MKKHFMYFEANEGGMRTLEILEPKELSCLYGWMTHGCKTEDNALIRWMEKAKIGDHHHHRVGTMVRLRDKNK